MSRDLTGDTLILSDVSERDARALLYVCSMAHDLDDARDLIDALGLNSRRIRSAPRQTYTGRCGKCHRTQRIKGRGLCSNCWRTEVAP